MAASGISKQEDLPPAPGGHRKHLPEDAQVSADHSTEAVCSESHAVRRGPGILCDCRISCQLVCKHSGAEPEPKADSPCSNK
jgi:hypothetical protein